MGNPAGSQPNRLASTVNLNEVIYSGFYLTSGNANQPGAYSTHAGILNVRKYSDGCVEQTWSTNTSSHYIYYRKYAADGATWTAWQRLDNFGYNSLAELASGVAPSLPCFTFSYKAKLAAKLVAY